jgi:hypothetical protein
MGLTFLRKTFTDTPGHFCFMRIRIVNHRAALTGSRAVKRAATSARPRLVRFHQINLPIQLKRHKWRYCPFILV